MKPIRLTISNRDTGGDYTGALYVGSQRQPVRLILDTGSSTLALDSTKYNVDTDTEARVTTLAQEVSYGSGWWYGAVVRTEVALAPYAPPLPRTDVAVTLRESGQLFRNADGILGLAFQPLNPAYDLGYASWPSFPVTALQQAKQLHLKAFFSQLEEEGALANKFAFYTLRSKRYVAGGAAAAEGPINQGYLILGGGEEAEDLYEGTFQTVKILHDIYYNVNLLAVWLGGCPPLAVPPIAGGPQGSNAFVDSGTNALILPPQILGGLYQQFYQLNPYFYDTLQLAAANTGVMLTGEALAYWPTLYMAFEGTSGNVVTLAVAPHTYWQIGALPTGAATFSIQQGSGAQTILGLPLMNNYFCLFDRDAGAGLGVIRFAPIKLPAA